MKLPKTNTRPILDLGKVTVSSKRSRLGLAGRVPTKGKKEKSAT